MIYTVSMFDYEQTKRLVFTVVAVDSGHPVVRSSTVGVIVVVIDINDERPDFVQQSYSFGTFENQSPGTEIGAVEAFDKDGPPFNRFVYSLRSGGTGNGKGGHDTFTIDPDTGTIVARRSLDREMTSVYKLTAVATELAHPHGTSTVEVTIHVADRNDNAPTIVYPSPDNRTVELSVHAAAGHVFARILATDADTGPNARLRFSIADDVADSGSELFDVDPATGALSVRSDRRLAALPDHVTGAMVRVVVRDSGEPQLASVAELDVLFNRSDEAAAAVMHKSSAGDGDAALAGNDDGTFEASHNPTAAGLPWFQHRELLIVLAAGTSLTVVVLIAAIICVRRRQFMDVEGEGGVRSGRSSKNAAKMSSAAMPMIAPSTDEDKFGPPDSTDVFLISADDRHLTNQQQQQRSRREPDLYIVRNVVGSSSTASDSPWRTLPPGSKVADNASVRFGTCGGKVSSAWAADTSDCLLPQQQSTLFTFSVSESVDASV